MKKNIYLLLSFLVLQPILPALAETQNESIFSYAESGSNNGSEGTDNDDNSGIPQFDDEITSLPSELGKEELKSDTEISEENFFENSESEIKNSENADTTIGITTYAGEITIDVMNFPDDNFRRYVNIYIDANSDGVLSTNEINQTTALDLSYKGISNLTGIQYFTNLTTFNCSNNQLSSLNLSNLTNLTSLKCSWNSLTSLNLSNLPSLSSLQAYTNNLSSLNLSNLPNLTTLNCSNNQLTSLNLNNFPKLAELFCTSNQLTSLDLSNLTSLSDLRVNFNNLTSLDLSNLPNFSNLWANNNSLTSLNLSNLPILTNFDCSNNQLTSLNLSNLPILTNFNCSNNQLTSLNLKSFLSIEKIYYENNPNLKTLDLRNCPNLNIAYHSTNQETVYISAGMTTYIGCDLMKEHTGNIVIDLAGFYAINPDGSKSVDLKTVISPTLISVFEQNTQTGYDPNTNILTIPAGEAKSIYTAGKDDENNPTHWTFYTNINEVDDIVATFNTNGGSIVEAQIISNGGLISQPSETTKSGYKFNGWYADSALTTPWNFETPITADTTLYAAWTKNTVPVVNHTVTFNSNGGTAVSNQVVSDGSVASLPTEPTRSGYNFNGWYADSALKTPWDFETPITADTTLYAAWTPVTSESITQSVNHSNSNKTQSNELLPKTGEQITLFSLFGIFLLGLVGFIFSHRNLRKKRYF
ncbi:MULTISPECIES: InlB B-repeat-containing protein [unclassified Enterococcus]|uniref:InlB B-repeat-containing protein n=1 Tax=unclassified Enterococcus TaxID=2608891 RepID=UPI001551C959|nr:MULTISPECIES: InlB B-repeat-containing protein [unclassified Enterococcus]MBS7577165.1 InlB B-repeat-containing protein [Enterococcus sp. MMGLQ5-2]MBS7584388.1 InlB B-repeat-containing protein [Enterococcus sp. MMGLQ5-1]NPD12243.1 LPXTG cell wall anchor domain-containing protein [Enterococcus sp. MMGLQ5-1]NPD36999.1 LPXTG cell wall anchor domain-containing protein [Enterococcus sp. MMGLQ5-2]